MNFSLYDILAQLIPGFVTYLSLLRMMGIAWDKDDTVPATALAFVAGYFVNALGSWLEPFYFWTWGGKPSTRLLQGRSIRSVRFYHSEQARQLLLQESPRPEASEDELFGIAMRHVPYGKDSRVETFNAQYAFSRNILTATLIALLLLQRDYLNDPRLLLLLLPTAIMAWQRCKERGYYLAKEVFQQYLKGQTTIKTTQAE